MKNTKISRWFAILLSAAILVSCMCIPAMAAADVSSLNPDEKGSISVTMKSDDTTATDGALTLYQVATLNVTNGRMSYTKTDDFVGFDGDLDVDDTDLAGNLACYVEENGLTGTEAKISSEGEASFDDLTLGLFLLIQTEQSTGFYTIDPVLVTVPIAENDEWVYNVDASPKIEVNPEPTTTTEPTTSPEPSSEPSESPEPSASSEPSSSPSPSSSTTPGTGGTSGTGGTGGTGGTSGTNGGGTSKTLPQTGQLNWPVALFAVLGVIFVVVGIVLVNTGRKRRSET